MRVDRYTDPAAFWNDAREFLERDEMGNTQLLALGSRHATEPGPAPPVGYTVATDDGLSGAALLMKNGTLFLSPSFLPILRALNDTIGIDRAVGDIVAEHDTALRYAEVSGI